MAAGDVARFGALAAALAILVGLVLALLGGLAVLAVVLAGLVLVQPQG